jgi:hypothetical protein
MDILPLFFEIDEFCQVFEPLWRKRLLADGLKQRHRRRRLSLSEVMTILVLFHQSGYRNLKQFYLEFVGVHLTAEFPVLVSYNRFARFERDALLPLAAYLQTKRGGCTGISFVDSTKLAVCTNLRIPRHKQFADFAGRGKTSVGWFYGFKLHITDRREGTCDKPTRESSDRKHLHCRFIFFRYIRECQIPINCQAFFFRMSAQKL